MRFELTKLKSGKGSDFFLKAILTVEVVFLGIRCFRPLGGLDAFRQAQTVWPIKIWNESGFSFLNPTIPIKGFSHQTWLLEFPIYQWIIYLIHQFTSLEPIYIARLVSMICALFTFIVLATVLARKIDTSRDLILVLTITNPFVMYWMTTGLVDWMALALGCSSAVLLISRSQSPLAILGASTAAIIGASIKPSHALFAFLTVLIVGNQKFALKKMAFFVFSFMILMAVTALLWQRRVTQLYPLESDPRSIWSINESTWSWYFGSIDQFVHFFQILLQILDRFAPSFGGIWIISLGLIGFAISNLSYHIKILVILTWLGYTFVLINLNVSHYYYQIPWILTFQVVVVIGYISIFRNLFISKFKKEFISILAIFFLINCFSSITNISYTKSLLVNERVLTECLPESEDEKDGVLLINWEDPSFFYECDLKSFQLNLSRSNDLISFEKEKSRYVYLYARDLQNLAEAKNFLDTLSISVTKLPNSESWYKLIHQKQ